MSTILKFEDYLSCKQKDKSRDGSIKYLFQLADSCSVEAVFIPESNDDIKMCISNQVGCSNKCSYCATGRLEYLRDMSWEEIVSQIMYLLTDNGIVINSISSRIGILFMGMGEAFFNYDNVMKTLNWLATNRIIKDICNDVIISTSGVVPKINAYADEPVRGRLAVSINATTDILRGRLMPISKVYSISEVISACKLYHSKTGDRLIFEYVLIENVNDNQRDADELLVLLNDIPHELQIIPLNECDSIPYKRPSAERIDNFMSWIRNGKHDAKLKVSYGIDIDGGCGQLALVTN